MHKELIDLPFGPWSLVLWEVAVLKNIDLRHWCESTLQYDGKLNAWKVQYHVCSNKAERITSKIGA